MHTSSECIHTLLASIAYIYTRANIYIYIYNNESFLMYELMHACMYVLCTVDVLTS